MLQVEQALHKKTRLSARSDTFHYKYVLKCHRASTGKVSSSSSAFDVMVVLTRSSLLWVPHTWMSGTNPLQTPRAWFWGTHKWAAALLADGVSRTVDNILVFGPPLHRGIEQRSLHQSSWDGYSVCSNLFWGERWWSVGVMAADGVRPGLGCILQSGSGRWLSVYYG